MFVLEQFKGQLSTVIYECSVKMSSEDSDAGPRKKKPRRSEDSPASTSSGSPIIGSSSRFRIKRKRQQTIATNPIDSSGSDSESGSPLLGNSHRRVAV